MSEVKVNKISPRTDCGTVQLGDSGDTITIPAGATITNNGTQTGFGRTGAVDWDTTAKTASFTAVSGNGYFVNTTSGAITVTLPATPSAGDIVAVADYAGTSATNNITIARNGSNINGAASDQLINNNNSGITLVYVDGTQGWKGTQTLNLNDIELQPLYIAATGGTVTCCGDYKIHTFTGPGTFTVSCAGNSAGSNTVDYLVIAGGGGGSNTCSPGAILESGAGGAGGFRLSNTTCMPAPQTSPLAATSGVLVTAQGYPITVGGGGTGRTFPSGSRGGCGTNSVFSTITSTGGGGGGLGFGPVPLAPGVSGGSGGGGGTAPPCITAPGGSGNTPPVSPPQGNDGGNGRHLPGNFAAGGGGGGAGAAGSDFNNPTVGRGNGGSGGAGSYVVSAGFAGCNGEAGPVCGARYFAGGGGGGSMYATSPTEGVGGVGGGGDGGSGPPGVNRAAGAGSTNTGGGGGGVGRDQPGSSGAGGSGIVIIRYKFQ